MSALVRVRSGVGSGFINRARFKLRFRVRVRVRVRVSEP